MRLAVREIRGTIRTYSAGDQQVIECLRNMVVKYQWKSSAFCRGQNKEMSEGRFSQKPYYFCRNWNTLEIVVCKVHDRRRLKGLECIILTPNVSLTLGKMCFWDCLSASEQCHISDSGKHVEIWFNHVLGVSSFFDTLPHFKDIKDICDYILVLFY